MSVSKIALLAACGAALLAAAVAAAIYVPRLLAGPVGKTEEVVTVNRGAFRIQEYERFYRLIEEVEAADAKLRGYTPPLGARELTECRGLSARRAGWVAEYNAASRAERTRGQWRALELPIELEHLTASCGDREAG